MRARMSPDERDEMLADLKQWPLLTYADIAAKYRRSVITVSRLARAWGLGRHGR